jgi:hypothetical protein
LLDPLEWTLKRQASTIGLRRGLRLIVRGKGRNYYIEGLDDIESLEVNALLLKCFVREGDRLLFGLSKNQLSSPNLEEVRSRIMYKNKVNLCNAPPREENDDEWLCWFRADSLDEIVEAIKLDVLFMCVVIPREGDFFEHYYVLDAFEVSDGDVLWIQDIFENDFRSRVLPKLKELLQDALTIVEK